jgi:hypothetical protein
LELYERLQLDNVDSVSIRQESFWAFEASFLAVTSALMQNGHVDGPFPALFHAAEVFLRYQKAHRLYYEKDWCRLFELFLAYSQNQEGDVVGVSLLNTMMPNIMEACFSGGRFRRGWSYILHIAHAELPHLTAYVVENWMQR